MVLCLCVPRTGALHALSKPGCIVFNTRYLGLHEGEKQTLTARFSYGDPAGTIFHYESSDPDIVSVDEVTGRVEGRKTGMATVSATADLGEKGTCRSSIHVYVLPKGRCGDSLYWRLDFFGSSDRLKLLIHGTGPMEDYSAAAPAPWKEALSVFPNLSYRSIVKVFLPNQLTYIGSEAFSGLGIGEMEIADTVLAMGEGAFAGCSALTAVHLSDAMETLPARAFYDCSALETVHLPAALQEIGSSAFRRCTGLHNIEWTETLESIGYAAFSECTALESVYVPDGVTNMDSEVFQGCTALVQAHMPSSLSEESFPTSLFADCTALERVDLSEQIGVIPWEMFKNCASLRSIVLPESVWLVTESAFDGCGALRRIVYMGTEEQWQQIAFDDTEWLSKVHVRYMRGDTNG